MKFYPTISHKIQNIPIYAFDKLDGSNIRVEWDKKKGFWRFGSRKCLIDETHSFLGESINLVKAFEQELTDIFKKERWQKVVCFFEYYGENSFAGRHHPEEHFVSLIDVAPYKKGILDPNDFEKLFGHIETARFLYYGNANQDFVKIVREGRLEGMTFEGVVCKVKIGRTPSPVMFKIKSDAWIKRLKEFCKGDEKLFQELL